MGFRAGFPFRSARLSFPFPFLDVFTNRKGSRVVSTREPYSAPRFNVSGEDGFSAVLDHEVRGDVQLVLGELGAAPETPAELLGERFELDRFHFVANTIFV